MFLNSESCPAGLKVLKPLVQSETTPEAKRVRTAPVSGNPWNGAVGLAIKHLGEVDFPKGPN